VTDSYHNDAVRHKFTGKERGSESGLDLFGARHYASVGRHMQPGPVFFSSDMLTNRRGSTNICLHSVSGCHILLDRENVIESVGLAICIHKPDLSRTSDQRGHRYVKRVHIHEL
jgi:hypothetical protein